MQMPFSYAEQLVADRRTAFEADAHRRRLFHFAKRHARTEAQAEPVAARQLARPRLVLLAGRRAEFTDEHVTRTVA